MASNQRRFRDGTLYARWSRAREHGRSTLNGERGDLEYVWGDGCKKSDGGLLHFHFGVGPWDLLKQQSSPSLLEELHSRGYDLTTLKFSIKKLRVAEKTDGTV